MDAGRPTFRRLEIRLTVARSPMVSGRSQRPDLPLLGGSGVGAVGAESASGCRHAPWPDNPLGRRRVDGEQAGRADGASDELAATIRTDPVQDVLRAVPAPGALVRADKHVRGCRVEVPVAAFAIRPQLQHMSSIDRQRRLEQAPVPDIDRLRGLRRGESDCRPSVFQV